MAAQTKEQLAKIVAAAISTQKAVVALANKAKDKKVPATKINEVLKFQTVEGTLSKDGLYGPNAVAALKFYLQKTSNPNVPPAAAKYASVKVTWKAPPLAPAPVTTAKPAPKPVAKVVSKPVAKAAPKPVTAPTVSAIRQPLSKEQLTKIIAAAMVAQKTLNNLVAKAKDKKVVATKISTVLSFQSAEGTLVKDGLYGPNVVTALKFYLQKTSNPNVPPAATKFAGTKVTWKAPPLSPSADLTKPIAAKAATPTPAPAPAPKLIPKPAAIKSAKSKPKSKVTSVMSKVPKPPPYGQELNTIKPQYDAEEKVVARVNGTKSPKTKPRDVEESIAAKQTSAAVANAITPQLKEIKRKLLKQDIQTQATAEHRSINKRDDFQRDVLTKLSEIRERLSGGTGISNSNQRRILGIIL